MNTFKTKPFNHQLDSLNASKGKTFFADLSEMGTGKTWTRVNEIAIMFGEGKIDSVIIFAPKGVHTNWIVDQIPKHMPDWVKYKAASWRASLNKKTKSELEALFQPNSERTLRVLAMNWDAIQNAGGMAMATRFANTSMSLMAIADESQRIKNPGAIRTKALMKLKHGTKYRRIMSGSPVLNSPFDLYAPFTWLDANILESSSFAAFKSEYAEMLSPGNGLLEHIARQKFKDWDTWSKDKREAMSARFSIVAKGKDGLPKYRNLEKLNKLIQPHSFRVLKKECLDLPEKIYTQAWFDMTPRQAKAYQLMEDEARLVLDSGETTAVAKLAAMMKLSQICSGFAVEPISGIVQSMHKDEDNPKLDLLKDRLDCHIENGKKIIVWARFTEEIKQISKLCDSQGWKFCVYNGQTSDKERPEIVAAFSRGEYDVFIGQQRAGGTGITLVRASRVIYYSNTFSLEDRLQSEDRAHRIGQEEDVTYEDILCQGTIDVSITRALRAKTKIADIITGDSKRLLENNNVL